MESNLNGDKYFTAVNIISVNNCLSEDFTLHLKTFKGADVQLKQFKKQLVFFSFLN